MQRLVQKLLIFLILVSFSAPVVTGQAADGGPNRQATVDITYTQYEWWLIRWSDNNIMCRVFVDHEGLPSNPEIAEDCSGTVYTQWISTPPCQTSDATCPGFYLYFIGSKPAQKTQTIDLPPPSVWIDLTGCTPTFPANLCTTLPSLRLTAEEPLPDEQITAVQALVNGRLYTCSGAICDIPLQPTPPEGITVEFWADSSFGDSSPHFTAVVRVIDSGVSAAPGSSGFYVDIVSSQWRGHQLASCAQTWLAFPPVGGVPEWLSTPEIPELLATAEPYYFLAGRLIAAGLVNASGCPNGGLQANGYADECGLTQALPLVLTWQNQFDPRILEVANETSVPAHLIKNLFAQESQFWPGPVTATDHLGLGHITDTGADVIFMWNRPFFNQFCPTVFDNRTCTGGYLRLPADLRAILRGALVQQAESTCPQCPGGVDLDRANYSVDLFARALMANCEQVSQIVYNATKRIPGTVSDYENLWRFTLANYHAGPGCLSYAIHAAAAQGTPITWERVATQFTPACQGVVNYVDQITR